MESQSESAPAPSPSQPIGVDALDWLRGSYPLPGKTSAVALELFVRGENGKPFEVRLARFAEELGLSEKVVRYGLQALQESGLIGVEHTSGLPLRVRLLIGTVPPVEIEEAAREPTPDVHGTSRSTAEQEHDLSLLRLSEQLIHATPCTRRKVLTDVAWVLRQKIDASQLDPDVAIALIADGLESNGLAPADDGRAVGRLLAETALGILPEERT